MSISLPGLASPLASEPYSIPPRSLSAQKGSRRTACPSALGQHPDKPCLRLFAEGRDPAKQALHALHGKVVISAIVPMIQMIGEVPGLNESLS